LLHIIWKTTKKVGFGIKGKWVVAWYCDVAPLSSLGEVAVESVESSPAYVEGSSRRRLLASSHRMLAASVSRRSNALDGDTSTAFVTAKGFNVYFTMKLRKTTKVQSVSITNAQTSPERFDRYRVRVGEKACGFTNKAGVKVAAGKEVVVACGEGPDYIMGDTVTIETTTATHL